MIKELQIIFDTLSTGVVVLNNKAEVKFLNKYMQDIVKPEHLNGERLGELFGNLFTCIHTEDRTQKCGETENCPECPLRNSLKDVSEASQIVVFEKEFYLTEEQEKLKKFFGISMKPMPNSLEGEVLIELFPIRHDKIEELYVHYQNLEGVNEKAYKDILTGLYNRNFYEEKIPKLYNDEEQLSMILLDIDNFKNLNDSKGHIEGDKLLQKLSKIIEENIHSESYGIRMGGDEFLIVTKKSSKAALDTAKIILSKAKEINKSISIGVAEKKQNFEKVNDLYKKADMALYTAKKNGKGMIVIGY